MSEDVSPSQLTVLDLPQIYTKPPFSAIHSTLASLTLHPESWSTPSSFHALPPINEEGIPAYLTRLISSPLAWLSSDAEREEIWEAASKRLSERSGRSGMSSLRRTFKIPRSSEPSEAEEMDIRIHEPGLVNDQLGHKTWLGAFVLAKLLPRLLPRYFALGREDCNGASEGAGGSQQRRLRILELGAGTGLAGIAAAALYRKRVEVHMTDLPEIVPNLRANIFQNSLLLSDGAHVSADVLDWSDLPSSEDLKGEEEMYDCILAADSLYGPEHPPILTDTIAVYLEKRKEAKVFTVLPFREMELDYHGELREQMATKGFRVLEEGEEVGVEDWYNSGANGAERAEVRCWWCVWGWQCFH
ncbi:MAG: Protein-lysine N-methyltransferase rrg1 [Ramalina farinacea]|uniref:Protein-lysine N-methyltransferase rrg1 n=1 Tax=Ramalina farinacea TaxID=258253 RepID=A0AA43QRV7_9LECA|nr:Protein-lysine N-methyltransferase rrg1 [Ramalina farinacea]